MITIPETLDQLSIENPVICKTLCMFPLRGGPAFERDYVLLAEALEVGSAQVREVSEQGSVPELLIENRGKARVLVFEGEELIGAKQNRTANSTILVPPRSNVHLPVTCVEAGRWDPGQQVRSSQQVHFARGRGEKMATVIASMKRSGTRVGDQSRVWSDIASKTERLDASAPTAAMADVYHAYDNTLEDYTTAFAPLPGQTGAVFAIGGRIEGAELFDHPETLNAMLPKLVRSYAIDAIEGRPSSNCEATLEDAQYFVAQLSKATWDAYDAIGEGIEMRMQTRGSVAAGLIARDRVIHLAAFASASAGDTGTRLDRGLARLRQRRRGMRG